MGPVPVLLPLGKEKDRNRAPIWKWFCYGVYSPYMRDFGVLCRFAILPSQSGCMLGGVDAYLRAVWLLPVKVINPPTLYSTLLCYVYLSAFLSLFGV
jgi:hypothetical protein